MLLNGLCGAPDKQVCGCMTQRLNIFEDLYVHICTFDRYSRRLNCQPVLHSGICIENKFSLPRPDAIVTACGPRL